MPHNMMLPLQHKFDINVSIDVQQFDFIFPIGWYRECWLKLFHMGKNSRNHYQVYKRLEEIKNTLLKQRSCSDIHL